jgi:hypothetical protein
LIFNCSRFSYFARHNKTGRYNSKVYTCHGCWFFLFWKMNTRKIKFISVDFILMFRSNYNWHISTDKIEWIKVMLTLLPFLRELQTFILLCWFELYVCTVVFCFWIILLFKIFNGHLFYIYAITKEYLKR